MRLPMGSVPPPGTIKAMARRDADEGLRRRGGFDHLHEGNRLDGREILRRLPHIFIGCRSGNRAHARLFFSGSGLEILHLADEILDGEAGDVGGFRMSLSRHEMAGAAGRQRDPRFPFHDPGRGADVHRETSPEDWRCSAPPPRRTPWLLPGTRIGPVGSTREAEPCPGC